MSEKNIEYLGDVIKTTFILDCQKGNEDGRDVLYFSVTGNPSTFVVYDVNEKKTIREILHTGGENMKCVWTQCKDNDENLYLGVSGFPPHLLKYDVKNKSLKHVREIEPLAGIYHLSCDEDNNIYFGTAREGKVFKYNDASDELTGFGTMLEDEKYVMSSVYHNGALYCGSRSDNPKFYRFDLKSEERKIIPLPEKIEGNLNALYYMTKVEKFVFIVVKMNDGQFLIICYNLEENKWEDVCETSLGGQHMTEPLDRITYFADEQGYMKGIHLDTLETIDTGILYYRLEKGDDGFDYANGFMNGGFFKLKDQEKYPGYTYITSNYDNNALSYINMTNKTVEFVNGGSILSKPIQIKALTNTPSGNIVMGGYMSTKGVLYDIDKNEFSEFYCRQTEGMAKVADKTYFGVYTRASIWEFDEKLPFKKDINPKPVFQVGECQDRPFAMCEADGKLLVGTIPDYYELGGALCLYDPSLKEKKVWRNLIEDQSITGVCCRDNIAYVSTGVWGGLSTVPSKRCAEIFSFDLKREKIINRKTLDFPFYNGDILHIGGLSFDSQGTLWGITSGTVFTLNPETLRMEKYINISGINWDIKTTLWKPYNLVELGDYMYCNPEEDLVRINKKTFEIQRYNVKAFMLTKGKDNKIYYCYGDSLYRCV